MSIATTTSTPIAHTSPTCASKISSTGGTKKRKRAASLHVRFCTDEPKVEYTYSRSDYDRSGLFPSVVDAAPMILAVSISVVAQPVKSTESLPPVDFIRPLKRNKSERPRLTIDTGSIHGPLFFTNLSTNHSKKMLLTPIDEKSSSEQDRLTQENTRRNR
ncbi:hypothetical protein BX666DRAFT_1924060 [Dichotomocladium elegans]|nr:hypothetical protein BX666DRAFT_1924060 [Dichotomocladium elegans]